MILLEKNKNTAHSTSCSFINGAIICPSKLGSWASMTLISKVITDKVKKKTIYLFQEWNITKISKLMQKKKKNAAFSRRCKKFPFQSALLWKSRPLLTALHTYNLKLCFHYRTEVNWKKCESQQMLGLIIASGDGVCGSYSIHYGLDVLWGNYLIY